MKKLGYILLSVIPGLLLTAMIFITSQVFQLVVSFKYFSNGGDTDMEVFQNYIVEYLQGDVLLTITIIGQLLAATIATLIIVKKMKGGEIFKNALNAVKKLNGISSLLAFVGLELVTSFTLMACFTLFPKALEAYEQMISTSGLAGFTVISTLATVVVAPLCEEIIFRGFTMKILEKTGWKFWIINIIQAALFGIYHLNVVQGLYAFALGLVLGLAFRKCNTIWASILGHAIYNFSGTYLIGFISKYITDSIITFIIPYAIGIILATVGIVMLFKCTTDGTTKEQ